MSSPGQNPYERIDALERENRQQALMLGTMASKLAELGAAFAALCVALGQNADALPGEVKPQSEGRAANKAKGSH